MWPRRSSYGAESAVSRDQHQRNRDTAAVRWFAVFVVELELQGLEHLVCAAGARILPRGNGRNQKRGGATASALQRTAVVASPCAPGTDGSATDLACQRDDVCCNQRGRLR